MTILELSIVLAVLIIMTGIGSMNASQVRKDGRKTVCVTNLSMIWTAKKTAWHINETLDAATGDATVLTYLDTSNLPYCPNPGGAAGGWGPASGVAATIANCQASYEFASATEATRPTCKVDVTHVR